MCERLWTLPQLVLSLDDRSATFTLFSGQRAGQGNAKPSARQCIVRRTESSGVGSKTWQHGHFFYKRI
jgi:hypothetical protein